MYNTESSKNCPETHHDTQTLRKYCEKSMWLFISLGIAYKANITDYFFPVDDKINIITFIAASMTLVLFLLVSAYANIYMRIIRGIRSSSENWKEYHPYAIRIASLSGVMSMLLYIVAIFPIFGLISIPMVTIWWITMVMFLSHI